MLNNGKIIAPTTPLCLYVAGADGFLIHVCVVKSAFMKGGEALMRPGVVQAGRQASFTEESKPSTPSAFERAGSETEEQRKARFR